jgi:hypothetical protein
LKFPSADGKTGENEKVISNILSILNSCVKELEGYCDAVRMKSMLTRD